MISIMSCPDRPALASSALIATFALVLCAPALALDEDHPVAQLRAQSNAAIAAQDVGTIVGMLDADYQITMGSGAMERSDPGHQAKGWQEIFDSRPDTVYRRLPERIDTAENGTRAFESGRWVGTWTVENEPIRYDGRYSAHWRVVDGSWKLRAELFVTLGCEGSPCP